MVGGPDSSSSADLHEIVKKIKAEAQPFYDLWDNIDREEIYHYTSVDTAYKILAGRVLWASDVLSMNDSTEFRHGVALLDEVLMSRWNVLPVAFAEYFRPRSLLLLGQTWDAFAVCFSSEGDLLSQWRAYPPNSNAEGVSIGFRISELHDIATQSKSFAIVKINYSSEDLRKAVHHMCDAALALNASRRLIGREIEVFWSEVAMLLLGFALRFKNPYYSDEREWRLLKLAPDKSRVMRRDGEGAEVKFIRLGFSSEAITRINVGPRAAKETDEQLRRFLADNGLKKVQVDRSAIPYR